MNSCSCRGSNPDRPAYSLVTTDTSWLCVKAFVYYFNVNVRAWINKYRYTTYWEYSCLLAGIWRKYLQNQGQPTLRTCSICRNNAQSKWLLYWELVDTVHFKKSGWSEREKDVECRVWAPAVSLRVWRPLCVTDSRRHIRRQITVLSTVNNRLS
jgi:hypothetical protein